MSLTFNGVQVKKVTLNGDDVKRINYNDTEVWTGISPILNENSWETISEVARAGKGADYWDIGDKKEIVLNGKIGDYLTLNNFSTYVFILDFNHPINKSTAMNNIIFGGFKTSDNIDIALCDSGYMSKYYSGKYFNMNHVSSSSPQSINYGGWKGCDFRYDILGGTSTAPSPYNTNKTTSTVGYDATQSTIDSPVANTLMAALPSDFRSVLRLWSRYVDNAGKGNDAEAESHITECIDAITLLAEYEVHGARDLANQYEQNHQRQMKYYKNGNSKRKKNHSATSTEVFWWNSSVAAGTGFCGTNPSSSWQYINGSSGVAPAFLL